MSWRRNTSVSRIVVLALVVFVLVGTPVWFVARGGLVAPAQAIKQISEAADTATAIAAAVRQGSDVVVADLTTESRIVRANAEGQLVAEISLGPVRVRRGKGWSDVDTTLARSPEGRVVPRATVMDIAFSGGGKAPLLQYGSGGKWIELSWPTDLPAPVLSGDTATYPEVYPGVDLVMRATRTGYTQRFVVKSAEAAKNKALEAIVLDLRAQDLTLKVLEDGALEARDKAGERVFAAPPSLMWDSAAEPKQAVVGVSIAAGKLTLKPDEALLSDPSLTFPLIIDPEGDVSRTNYSQTYSGKGGTAYWNRTAEPNGWHQVGQCWNGAGECGGIGAARLYMEFGTEFLNGKVIVSSWLNTTSVYGPNWNCTQTQQHQLYWSHGGIGGGTTWNNQPGGTHLSNADIFHSNSKCPGSRGVGFFAGTWVNNWGGRSTYFIQAANEGDQSAWRKYDPWAARLWVRYNTVPNTPEEPSITPFRPACQLCNGIPYLADDIVNVGARLSDNDGDQVRPVWDIAGDVFEGGAKNSGDYFQTEVWLYTRPDGTRVRWSVKARDWNNTSGARDGQEFAVDRTPVDKLPTVSGDLYRADGRWHGGVGVPGSFTFGANGITDIDHYKYGWDDRMTETAQATVLGGSVTVTTAPPKDGPRDLYVRSVDKAGRQSETKTFHVYVRPGSGPVANWSFEGSANDTAHLGDRHGTLSGTTSFGPAAVGNGLTLDGPDRGRMTAPAAVNTAVSFSVSAWVRIDEPNHARSIVSQDGPHANGFVLWYRPENGGRWVFGIPTTPNSTDFEGAGAPGNTDVGKWTHVAGVYDAASKQMRLYVNGRLAGTATRHHAPWEATGSVRIGQILWDGRLVDDLDGAVDEVQIYDRTLTAAEVRAMVARDNVQLGHWKFDEAADSTTAPNAVPGGKAGVLVSGAAMTGPTGGITGGSVRLTGDPAHVSMGGPVVRTDATFTVAAWLRIDEAPAIDHDARCALSQDGNIISGFGLCYRRSGSTGYWEAYAPSADQPSGTRPSDVLVRSSMPAQIGVPTHVAAVFNAAEQKIVLYVDGQKAGEVAWTNRFNASGPFTVGRFRGNSTMGNYWKGLVDEVRAYSRVLDEAEIQGIVAQNKVAQGWWKLDGDLTDSSPAKLHGTEPGGKIDYAAGQSNEPSTNDLAAQLNGSSTYISANHAVDTRYSYSVSAWARLDKNQGSTVVSQDGNHVSAFQIQSTPDGHWSFVMYGTDAIGGGDHHRVWGPLVQIGIWTHLTGVYDAAAGQLHFYVNGELVGSSPRSNAWDVPSGKLLIGAGKMNDNRIEHFPGAIDDVVVFGRTLFADEIRGMAGRDLSLVHHWTLDEPSGKYAGDSVGNTVGTVAGSPSRAEGRIGNAVHFDGVDDVVTSQSVGLRTDRSFAVSGWVYLESMACNPGDWCKRVAVSIDGPDGSKFRLGHIVDDGDNQYGSWFFEMPDQNIEVPHVAAVYAEQNDLNRWVHLTGVYDQPSRTVWIYVDGVRQGDGFLDTPWNTTGGVVVGRGKADGLAGERWQGNVDDVRLYTGSLDLDRVNKLFHSFPAPKAPVKIPTDAVGYWKLDKDFNDSSGRNVQTTPNGTLGWVGGRAGWAATLDGTSAYLQTSGPVLHTEQSFSASAWAYVTDLDNGDRTVLSQNAINISAFELQYQAQTRKWAVTMPIVDAAGSAKVSLVSAEPAQGHTWVHLATTYDRPTQELKLYVNGVLSSVRIGVVPITSVGPFVMGRGWRSGGVNHFKWVIDEVRAYQRTLTDGEVRGLHDAAGASNYGAFRFDDGTPDDASWRKNPVVTSTTEKYGPGISGKGMVFDGVGASMRTTERGVLMDDSFSVAVWAKLDHKNQVATAMAQEGARASGFFLQYRPQVDRWVFGAPVQDADGSPLVYAAAPHAPQVNEWVHLAGVYDYAGRQLRLYVNGELVSTKDNVGLWKAYGGLTIGRGRINAERAEFFPGTLDEAYTYVGALKDSQVVELATWPAPAAGQFGRYVNGAGERYTAPTGQTVLAGYRIDAVLGTAVPTANADTTLVYRCANGGDFFTSVDSLCEGHTKVGDFGLVYQRQPSNVATIPIYKCSNAAGRFDSRQSDCEGSGANGGVLGYSLAYAVLTRFYGAQGDHWSDLITAAPGYHYEGPQGFTSLTAQPGTVPLMSCRDRFDQFVSTSATCDGKTVLGPLGHIWSAPPSGIGSMAIYDCKVDGHQHMVGHQPDCYGFTVVGRLGYVLGEPHSPSPVFS